MIKHDLYEPLYISAQTSVQSHYNIRERSKGIHVVVEGLFNVRNELSPLHVPLHTKGSCLMRHLVLEKIRISQNSH